MRWCTRSKSASRRSASATTCAGQLARPPRVRPAAARHDRPDPPGHCRLLRDGAGHPRHEHQWRVWEDVPLPEGKKLIPGVVTHHTNVVDIRSSSRSAWCGSPMSSARTTSWQDRCGFAQGSFIHRVHPEIQWAKLTALAEGARIASRELWGKGGRLGSPAILSRRPCRRPRGPQNGAGLGSYNGPRRPPWSSG